MSLKAKCEATLSDVKSNVAVSKYRDMSAIYASSISLQRSPPENLIPSSLQRTSTLAPRKDAEDVANCGPASTPISFTKVIRSKEAVYNAECCRMKLPPTFCEEHNVERNLTMTDSTGHKLWHMRFQMCGFSKRRTYTISNGWREFSYDHSLKVNDMLVFTLVSTSHFIVEFATANGSTRAMLPTRDGQDYPWQINYSRLDCLSFADVQGVKKKGIRKDVADTKNRDTPAVNGSSVLLQPNLPEYWIPPSRRQKRSPSRGGKECASPPRSFTKTLTRKCGSHTARCCRLLLPRAFCEKNNVERNVTMTDSTGHKLWDMRLQPSSLSRRSIYAISNGWREFSYDHSLKVNDRLVFTLVSTSHFIVEFATSDGSTRAMLPTRDGTNYPWRINYARLDCLSVADVHGEKKKEVRKVATIVLRNKQKPQKEMFCQCHTAKDEKGRNNTSDTRKVYVLPELTHLECKNPDGSPYLQIFDSDSEMTSVDED